MLNLTKGFLRKLIALTVDKTNEKNFVSYIKFLNNSPFLHIVGLKKIQKFLLYIPKKRPIQILISSPPVNFEYATDTYDDLNYESRSFFMDYEVLSRIFFFLASKNSRNVLDIGAYSAIYSITSAKANELCNVYAFEPNPRIAHLALRNIHLNEFSKQIHLMPFALSDQSGFNKLYFNESRWENATASLKSKTQIYVEVETKTLDEVFHDSRIDLIKIDVEGFESEVFRGGIKLLKKFSPIILSEILTQSDLQNQSFVLRNLGYEEPLRVSNDLSSSDSRNYLWFNQENMQSVVDMLDQAKAIKHNYY